MSTATVDVREVNHKRCSVIDNDNLYNFSTRSFFFFFLQNDVLLQFEGLKYYEIYACTMKTPDKES